MAGTTPLPDRRRIEYGERRLDRHDENLPGVVGRSTRFRGQKHIRIARTTKDSNGNYPKAGDNVFHIIFQDAHAKGAVGKQKIQARGRSAAKDKHKACFLPGGWVPPGALITVYWDRGVNWKKGDVEWWIDTESTVRFVLIEDMQQCGKARAKIVAAHPSVDNEADAPPDFTSASESEAVGSEGGGESGSGDKEKERWCPTRDPIEIWDSLGVIGVAFPGKGKAKKGTYGFAKHFEDSGKFEVIQFGEGCCEGSSSSSGSGSESHSESRSESSQSNSSNSNSSSESRSESSGSGSNLHCIQIPHFSFDAAKCEMVECFQLLCFPKGLGITMGPVQCPESSSSSGSES